MADEIKPLPSITPLTEPFWNAMREHRLALQHCRACNEFVWTPRPACTECGSDQLEWSGVSGKGTVYSFTIIRQVTPRGGKGFEKEVPYIVAWIELDEGPRLCSNVVDCLLDCVAIGMPVEVVFEEADVKISLPKFRPRTGKENPD